MSENIRNTHDLATIRILLRPARSGLELSFSSFLGSSELEHRDLAAAVVGIQSDLSIRAYSGVQFQVPDEVLQPITGSLLAKTGPDEPFWLQVGSSEGHLGVVPWERHLQPPLGRPLLRIPNFLADPVFLGGRLRAALVVSSPRAKTPFSVEEYSRELVAIAQHAVPQGTELHVFADVDAYDALHGLPSPAGHSVVVHDPHEVDTEGGTDFERRGPDARLESPWLTWIRSELGGQALDLVHFVCPGFFRRSRGALALARSPGENEDRRWSHFIGVEELITFLDLVGAWSVGFSPPYENVWAIGLRLLADRLAWQRPGPLFVHDIEHGTPEDLVGAYRFLFDADDEDPPSTPGLSLYSHPRRMQRYRTSPVDAYEGATPRGFGAQAGEEIPEQLVMLATKGDRSSHASGGRAKSAWVHANSLQLDRMLLEIGRTDSPRRRGALDALATVSQLFDSVRSFDGTSAAPNQASEPDGDDEAGPVPEGGGG